MADEERMTPIGEIYMGIQRDLDQKYRNAVVLMEIGKFYEVYTFEMGGEEIGRAKEVSRVCNILLTRKNKSLPVSGSNPHMCGFPSHSLSRYVGHLVEHQHTVAVYEQKMDCGTVKRECKGIYSPAVIMEEEEEMGSERDRGLLSIRCEPTPEDVWIVIFVHVNITTGAVSCEEISMDAREASAYVQRILDMFRPQEMIRFCAMPMDQEEKIMIHDMPSEWTGANRRYGECEYQEKVLSEVFPMDKMTTMLSCIERLGLERHPDLVPVLVHQLDFLRAHHPLAVFRLQPPRFETRSEKVFLSARALYDLDIFPGKLSLSHLLDDTKTRGGGRLLRRTLFSPIHEAAVLQRRYEEIEALLPLVDTIQLQKKLQHPMLDAEHQMRRVVIGSIGVQAAYRLLRFLMDVRLLMEDLPVLFEAQEEKQAWDVMEREVLDRWDLHFMQTWRSWETSGIWRVTPPELMEKEAELLREDAEIRRWIRETLGDEMIDRLVLSEEDAHLQITKRMAKEIRCEGAHLKTMSSGVRVQHARLDRYFMARRSLLHFLSQKRRALFQRDLGEIIRHDIMYFFLNFMARVDVALCHARNVKRFRLTRPRMTENGIQMKQVRHLIVQEANPGSRFVPNDVDLTDQRGILLFGQNSAGKSTLMKSVAVAVLMAQSGMFVPCESMSWRPVRSLLTKIGSRDNIWKGKSTFITEMMELRHILERSDDHSLILCDELTSGTETFSATGIVASTIQRLAEQESFFIMTTHLHTLKRFTDLPVRIMHIGLSCIDKKLVFDRLLREGAGKSIYGLEIAEYLGFSPEFVQKAYDFRGRLEEEPAVLISNQRSRYNKKKIMDRCENCKSTKELHTHHIAHQADADEDGYIGTHHKNVLHNLKILCRACHDKEHHSPNK